MRLFFILLILVMAGCKNHGSNNHLCAPPGGFTKMIYSDSLGKPDVSYDVKERFTKKLGLSNIQDGVEEFESRVWFFYPMSDTVDLLQVKDATTKLEAKLYRFVYYQTYGSKESLDSISLFSKRSLLPQSGVKKFRDKLSQYNFCLLQMPIYNPADAINPGHQKVISLEISTNKYYKFQTLFPSIENGDNQLLSYISFLKAEFNLNE